MSMDDTLRPGQERNNDRNARVLVRASQTEKSTDTVADVDPLADVLDLTRVSGALMASVRAAHPWGLDLPQSPGASFHAVTSGHMWVRIESRAPLQLFPGDVLLLPTGIPHHLV